jgi:hypothetical protein
MIPDGCQVTVRMLDPVTERGILAFDVPGLAEAIRWYGPWTRWLSFAKRRYRRPSGAGVAAARAAADPAAWHHKRPGAGAFDEGLPPAVGL